MKIVVTGASGTIGTPAVDLLLAAGHQMTRWSARSAHGMA
jgi:uncharacterized protein YbjT (DUF2867 family)